MATGFLDEYLTKDELAESLGVSVRTLDRWHLLRAGPPRTRAGKKVLYQRAAIIDWLDQQVEPSACLAVSSRASSTHRSKI